MFYYACLLLYSSPAQRRQNIVCISNRLGLREESLISSEPLIEVEKINFPAQWKWIGEIYGKDKETLQAPQAGQLYGSYLGETVSQSAQITRSTTLQVWKKPTYPLKKANGPSLASIVIAQLGTLVYCPGVELTNLVFTTSTGEDRTVVQNPATTADTKWQGTSSEMDEQSRSTSDT